MAALRILLGSRCRQCRVRIGPGKRTCTEHTSAILSEAEMAALYAEAMRGRS